MELGEYLILALALSAGLGLVGSLAHPNFLKECEAAVGVISLLALAVPVLAIVGSLESLPEVLDGYVADGVGGYAEVGASALEDGVAKYLAEELSLEPSEVRVELCGVELTEMRAQSARVTLSGRSALADISALRARVEESFLLPGGRCEVVINIEGS